MVQGIWGVKIGYVETEHTSKVIEVSSLFEFVIQDRGLSCNLNSESWYSYAISIHKIRNGHQMREYREKGR